MKKFLCFVIAIAVLLSCCACGQKPEETKPAASGSNQKTPEEQFGHIDQLTPEDGVYQIWSEVGVKNMAAHPDADFELLCNIDMGGAVLEPIGTPANPFTGDIKGADFTISNFSIAPKEGVQGFVGVNKGFVRDLRLADVQMVTDETVKYAGVLAAVNESRIMRCQINGASIQADKLAEGAAVGGAMGTSSKELTSTPITVDVLCNAPGAAVVGGIVGEATGGLVEYVDSDGAITVTGENKTVGLLAGKATDTEITYCVFVGADNSLNGQLFTNLATGDTEDNFEGCAIRDNTPVVMTENQRKLRQRVVDQMDLQTSFVWRVRESLKNDEGAWSPGYTYFGFPYKHACATYARMQYLLDDEGYVKDFAYDLPSNYLKDYMGNDCSTCLITALWTVSNSVDFGHCSRQYPWDETGGCLFVGDWEPDPSLSVSDSRKHIDYNGEQKMYEAYAQLKMGDFYVYHIPDVGGHTRMVAENAVVVRNMDGTINPDYSYVVTHEQGWTTSDTERKTHTTCRNGYPYTFANLLYDAAVPVTCEELVTGEMEPATCELIGGSEGKMGLTTGTIKTNYYLDYVDMVITDSKGNEVFNQRMFPGLGRVGDRSEQTQRFYLEEFDMGRFAPALAQVRFENGETYSYKISATNAPGDTFLVKEASFVNGQG